MEITRARFRKSDTVGKIAEALAKAQKVLQHAQAGSENPHFKSHYADLSEVVDAIKDPLADNGIARTQFPVSGYEPGEVGVVTCLIHTSGEWLEGEVYCKPEKGGPQALGSVITYLRRYSLAAATGLAQTDDDAESAEVRAPAKRAPSTSDKMSPSQHVEMQILRKELQIPDEDWRAKLMAYFGKTSSQDLTRAEAIKWVDLLRKSKIARTSPPTESPPSTLPPKSS